MLELFSLYDLVHNVTLEAFPEDRVSLSWSSLTIGKDSWVETAQDAIETVLNRIEDVSLAGSLIEDLVESWLKVAWVVWYFEDIWGGVREGNLLFPYLVPH